MLNLWESNATIRRKFSPSNSRRNRAGRSILRKKLFLEPYEEEKSRKEKEKLKTQCKERLKKKRAEAQAAINQMQEKFRRIQAEERAKHGLVILEATYGVLDVSNERIDVTVPLQCLVKNSKLALPSGPKSQLPGFYDPAPGEEKKLKIKGSMKVYTEYVVIAYSLPLILHATTYWRFQELVNFMNEHMNFHRIIKAIADKEGEVKIGKDCDRLLRFMWRSGYLICWLNLVVGFRRPKRPVLLSSLVEGPTGLTIWQRILLVIPHVYVWWTMWAVMHLLALHIVASVHVVSSTAAYLKNMAKVGGLREGIKFAHLFRALQILRIKQGAALGRPISAHQLPFVLMIIRSIYGALKGEGLVRVLQGVIGFCAWLYLQLAFRALGSIHKTSDQALRMGKRMVGNSWFRKFLRSCKPLKVTVGGLYYVDKGIPLTLAAIILESTVNLLIAEK